MTDENFIACGMYAFTDAQQQAWQELFDHFEIPPGTDLKLRRALDFGHGGSLLRDPALFFGQTCGYPLMTQLRDEFTPFCVALFDVPGTQGKYYSSQIIVHADSDIDSLSDCDGRIAAINNADSNSGMNVFRYELARLGAWPGFFSDIVMSGGHLQSVEAVASQRADVATIDCVTFQLVVDAYPELIGQVRSIGCTVRTCGLPFVFPGTDPDPSLTAQCLTALQNALEQLSTASRECLHLVGFEAVDFSDYDSILELENYALDRGMILLN